MWREDFVYSLTAVSFMDAAVFNMRVLEGGESPWM